MDADLYDQLNTTITHPSEHRQSSDSPIHGESVESTEVTGSTSTTNAHHHRTTSTSLPQEIDQVVHTITTSPWVARLGNLVGNVKKQVSSMSVALTPPGGICL
jgi:hypothetical protein